MTLNPSQACLFRVYLGSALVQVKFWFVLPQPLRDAPGESSRNLRFTGHDRHSSSFLEVLDFASKQPEKFRPGSILSRLFWGQPQSHKSLLWGLFPLANLVAPHSGVGMSPPPPPPPVRRTGWRDTNPSARCPSTCP